MKRIIRIAFILLGIAGLVQAQSFDPLLADKLQNTLESIRKDNNIKGISACIIYPGVGVWKGVTGFSHAGAPITPDMEFGIGSNTKLFTGVLLLKLAERQLLKLDDSLKVYLPAIEHVDPNITIRQLLNHTSGLADVTNVQGYPDSILKDPRRIYTAAELMGWLDPPTFAAGTSWSYCNTNYLLAGMIAERVSGQRYGKLLRDSILTPLQLDSTFLDVYDSVLYTVAHPWQGGADYNATPRTALNSAAWAAGGMYSTSGEMAQWYQALMNGRVLNAQSFKEMTTFVGSGNYGIGISKALASGRTVWQHGGTIWGGYNTFMLYDTATGIIICVLINQLPAQALPTARQLLTTLINTPVGIRDHKPEATDCKVYPNPTRGLVHIDMPDQNIRSVRIFNTTGQLLQESFESDVPMSSLPAGMYFVHVQTENGIYRQRLLKE